MPANRLALATREKETEEQDSEYVNPESSADKSSISLIMTSNVGEGEDFRQTNDESMAESSQSIISYSHEYGSRTTEENPQIGDASTEGVEGVVQWQNAG